jgi:membrane-associated phospholipid phosphatase
VSTILTTPSSGVGALPIARTYVVRRPAAMLALIYLAVSFPALLLNGIHRVPIGMASVHLLAMVALVWAVRRPGAQLLADWLALALTAFFYAELPSLIAGVAGLHGPVYHDAVIQGWEAAVFGGQPSHQLAGALPWLWLSEPVHAGYLAYYILIFGPPLVLYLRGRREAFAATQLAILATFIVCYVVFILFPVEGPRYAWTAPPGIPNGPVRRLALWLLEGGSSRGTAFPSSHAAVAVAATVSALRYQPRLGAGVLFTTVLLVIGAVYGGFHYGIDMTAGVLVGLTVSMLALRWFHGRVPASAE